MASLAPIRPSESNAPRPALILVIGFLTVITIGTALLSLPLARAEPGRAPFMVAWFTAWSATCINGLSLVDTGAYWSGFGQGVILALIQFGGLGMMTSATLLLVWAGGGMRLKNRMLMQAETRSLSLGDVRTLGRLILIVTFSIEAFIALLLTLRFALGHDMPWGMALWQGVFHAVSSYCNAGFSLYGDSLIRYVGDPWVLLPCMVAVVIGGVGFPVIHELWVHRGQRHHHWSMHTVLTLWGSAILIVGGMLALLAMEWTNPKTLGELSLGGKVLAASFTSVAARSVGLNVLDMGLLHEDALALHYMLMFIGAGSAGTGGGVKVTTFFILLVAVWSEIRGDRETVFRGRRIPVTALRQALTILVLSSAVIVLGLFIVLPMTDEPYPKVVFEVVSAAGNVGLSTGITASLPPAALFVLMVLMFSGRVGVVTLAMALSSRTRRSKLSYPEEKTLVG